MDKKSMIIEVATQLFAERGFENTPISLICETAGVSKGLVFHHFSSKNELLREIFAATTALIVEINSNIDQTRSAKEQLLSLIESVFEQLSKDKSFFQMNLNIMLQPNTRSILQDLIKERSSFLLDAIQRLFQEIAPENYQIKSYLFIAELDGIALDYLCIFDNYPLPEIKTQLLNRYA